MTNTQSPILKKLEEYQRRWFSQCEPVAQADGYADVRPEVTSVPDSDVEYLTEGQGEA